MTQIADNHDLNHHGYTARRHQLLVERIELIGPSCRYREVIESNVPERLLLVSISASVSPVVWRSKMARIASA